VVAVDNFATVAVVAVVDIATFFDTKFERKRN
jgi:hypothetical protein